MNEQEITLLISNLKGLHARAAAVFVETVEGFEANAVVAFDGMVVSGDSIMGLMMLGAKPGSEINVTTSGAQADELAAAISELVNDKFGEDKE